MEIIGTITEVLPVVEGESKNGPWRKQEIILEYGGKYPRKACITLWGDQVLSDDSAVGKTADISYNLESRENNGRWYTDAKAWRCSLS